MAYTTILETDKCVMKTKAEMHTNLQTHCCIATDATNMFNCSNQEICAANLDRELPGLLLYYKAIYGDNINVWYIAEDSSNQKLCQEDGYIQGGPLSSILSAIRIKPLVEEMQRLVTEQTIETVKAARNNQNIPSDHSIFHFFHPRLWVDDTP